MIDGFLVKLTIIPFDKGETIQAGPPSGPPFIAQINPESFTVNNEINYSKVEPAQGGTGDEAKFGSIKPRSFSFDFTIDGTGAGPITIPPVPSELSVITQVANFQLTTGFFGKIHRPNFLVITWGSFFATCVLESYSVNYKLFDPTGIPLRAVLSAKFLEHTSKTFEDLLKNLSSPDVSHAHEVIEGDHLALLTHQYYDSPERYVQVARFNGLNTVRSLKVGELLSFPPVTNDGKTGA
jgi:hypothetical protein